MKAILIEMLIVAAIIYSHVSGVDEAVNGTNTTAEIDTAIVPEVPEVPVASYKLTGAPLDVAGNGANAHVTAAYETVKYSITVENTGSENITGIKVYDIWSCGKAEESIATDGILQVNETWIYAGEYITTYDDATVFDYESKFLENTVRVIADNAESKRIEIQVPVTGNAYETIIPGEGCYFVGADGHTITLENNLAAKDPSYSELMYFLQSDMTDSRIYDLDSYVCADYAEAVHNNAEMMGIKCAWVDIEFVENRDEHACNAFNTVDRGMVFVDCTEADKKVSVAIGEEYTSESIFSTDAYYSLGKVKNFNVWW
jgi:uncharacterized repeat protein (TIGR01451 family)